MSFAIAVQLLALVVVASAQAGSSSSSYSSASLVSILPTISSVSEHYSSPYTYITYYSHHKQYIYTYETCSSPPSSIEICLSSVFSTMELALTLIESELKKYEKTIKYNMHHEHTLLSSEVSFVYEVELIAKSVRSVVDAEYYALYNEVYDLLLEKQQISAAYYELGVFMGELEAEIKEFQQNVYEIQYNYQYVEVAKWSVYSAISAIIYEKGVVQAEVAEIEVVVEELNIQMQKIAGKISQLNKRQSWLVSWQDKLYIYLSDFESDVKRFKEVQEALEVREVSIFKEQYRLYEEVEAVEKAIFALEEEYEYVVYELQHIKFYEEQITEIYSYVAAEARIFISAYEEFTCEDSLLYYEACTSASHSSISSVAPAPAKPAKPAKPVKP